MVSPNNVGRIALHFGLNCWVLIFVGVLYETYPIAKVGFAASIVGFILGCRAGDTDLGKAAAGLTVLPVVFGSFILIAHVVRPNG